MNPELKRILDRLNAIQTEYKGKAMPQNVGEEFDKLAGEAKAMQDEADREKQIKAFEKFAAEVPNPALPVGAQASEEREEKQAREQAIGGQVAGYISAGELFTNSQAYQNYVKSGAPAGVVTAPVELKGLHGHFIPLTAEQRKAVEAGLREQKAVVTIGAGVISADRVEGIVRATERDELTIRDLVTVLRTNSSSVDWVRIASNTYAAAVVAESAAKPEATFSVETVSSAVRTIAVWMPVTEQQLQDAPQITDLINGELLYDLDRAEEAEMMYGDGTGQHFLGILADTGVLAGRTVSGDTLIDKVRRAMTDVRRSGYVPNGMAVDPLDWETMVLEKGTDDRYVWAVVPSDNGNRIWGMRVVETTAVEANAGDTTEARSLVVGDFRRGAVLWDRMQAQVSIGWINDQFIKNQRTIRAEKRAAFAVRAPKAFRKVSTQAAVE